MGSQLVQTLRQGVWASLTGGVPRWLRDGFNTATPVSHPGFKHITGPDAQLVREHEQQPLLQLYGAASLKLNPHAVYELILN